MNPEQQEELEVLQSIYPDSFTEVSKSPPEWQLRIDSDMITINLIVVLPDNYPNEVPAISIDCARGKYPDMSKLKTDLTEEAEKCLGMAMVYTLCSIIEERLADFVRVTQAASKKASDGPKESYNEVRKFEGTPVTVERFLEWNAKFLQDMAAKRSEAEERRKAELGNKLTGRQLFEMNKVTVTSDSAFYDEAGLNIDEAVFDGLDELDLSDDAENENIDE